MDKVHIKLGKKVLDNLIEGMYSDSFFVFREYIQNASDSIDDAVDAGLLKHRREGEIIIDLSLDTVIIKDNGTGIKKEDFISNVGDIGASKKDSKVRKGFRGIGRLGGIAYCEELQFITSAQGEETKSILTVNCKNLNAEINDRNNDKDAATIFSENIFLSTEKEIPEKRFFNVVLKDIKDKKLLDKGEVVSYLSRVSPVPFSSGFSFKKKIKSFLEEKSFDIPEYNIFVNNDAVYKLYVDHFYEAGNKNKKIFDQVYDVQLREIQVNGKILALIWFGISKFEKALPLSSNPMAGLRFRQWNIEVGDDTNTINFFSEKRGTYYFVGEIHTAPGVLKANARRDGFTYSNITQKVLDRIKNLCIEELTPLYRKANVIKNYLKSKDNFETQVNVFNSRSENSGWENEKHKEELKNSLTYKYNFAKTNMERLKKLDENKDDATNTMLEIYKAEIDNFNIESLEKTKSNIIPDNQIKVKFKSEGLDKEYFFSVVEEVLHERLKVSKANSILEKIKDKLK